jgi:hypothetical protein
VGPVAQSLSQLATDWTVRGSNPSGGEIFRTCPDRPWGPPNLLYSGYRVFPRGVNSGRDVTLTPHPLPVPWSRKGRAIPPLPLWPVRPVQSLSACTRVHFTYSLWICYLFESISSKCLTSKYLTQFTRQWFCCVISFLFRARRLRICKEELLESAKWKREGVTYIILRKICNFFYLICCWFIRVLSKIILEFCGTSSRYVRKVM